MRGLPLERVKKFESPDNLRAQKIVQIAYALKVMENDSNIQMPPHLQRMSQLVSELLLSSSKNQGLLVEAINSLDDQTQAQIEDLERSGLLDDPSQFIDNYNNLVNRASQGDQDAATALQIQQGSLYEFSKTFYKLNEQAELRIESKLYGLKPDATISELEQGRDAIANILGVQPNSTKRSFERFSKLHPELSALVDKGNPPITLLQAIQIIQGEDNISNWDVRDIRRLRQLALRETYDARKTARNEVGLGKEWKTWRRIPFSQLILDYDKQLVKREEQLQQLRDDPTIDKRKLEELEKRFLGSGHTIRGIKAAYKRMEKKNEIQNTAQKLGLNPISSTMGELKARQYYEQIGKIPAIGRPLGRVVEGGMLILNRVVGTNQKIGDIRNGDNPSSVNLGFARVGDNAIKTVVTPSKLVLKSPWILGDVFKQIRANWDKYYNKDKKEEK